MEVVVLVEMDSLSIVSFLFKDLPNLSEFEFSFDFEREREVEADLFVKNWNWRRLEGEEGILEMRGIAFSLFFITAGEEGGGLLREEEEEGLEREKGLELNVALREEEKEKEFGRKEFVKL